MSPEQVKGGEIDARTDLFSLGIILFLMLTGQKPFLGDTASVMFKIVYEDPALPSSINPQLAPAYDYVVLKCLAKDRDKRYASARDLLNDLDDLQQGRRPRSQLVVAPAAPPAPKAAAAPPATEQTLVTTVPILVAPPATKPPAPPVARPPQQAAPPPPPRAAVQPPMPAAPPPPPMKVAPPPPTVVAPPQTVEPLEAGVPAPARASSNLLPIISGVVALLLLAAAGLGYWKYHQVMNTPVPPPHAAFKPPPPPPPDLVATQPVKTASQPEKKPVVRKPKPAANPTPALPAPAPPPPQPALAVLPPPKPVTPPPGAEAAAKPEAPKFSNVPRIVQIHCNFDLKEATYTVSGGGQTLFQGSFKGKKKGGFLGIKGAFEGAFSRTVTVPAGAAQVTLHVVSKDGAVDLSKAIKMVPPGGFVPTLEIDVEEDQIQMSWQSASKPKS
jgi:hypothetical protein